MSKMFKLVSVFVLFSFLFTCTALANKKSDGNIIDVKKESYKFTVSVKPSGVDKGKVIFKVTTPQTAKINKDYPNKLMLTSSDTLTLDKTKLTGKDATKLTKDTLEMELSYTLKDPKKGGSFDAKMKFGVCNMKGGEVFSCQFFTEQHKVIIPAVK